jgi:hypothetical protein
VAHDMMLSGLHASVVRTWWWLSAQVLEAACSMHGLTRCSQKTSFRTRLEQPRTAGFAKISSEQVSHTATSLSPIRGLRKFCRWIRRCWSCSFLLLPMLRILQKPGTRAVSCKRKSVYSAEYAMFRPHIWLR